MGRSRSRNFFWLQDALVAERGAQVVGLVLAHDLVLVGHLRPGARAAHFLVPSVDAEVQEGSR